MATITLRLTKGFGLTYAEIDANFFNLNQELTGHIVDTVDAHDASAISYNGSVNIVSGNVESAIDQLDAIKLNNSTGSVLPINLSTGAPTWNSVGALSVIDSVSVAGGSIFITPKTNNAVANIEVGQGRTGDGTSFIDLIGDTFYTDYGLRLSRNAGQNGGSSIEHRGSGALSTVSIEGGQVRTVIGTAERMRLTTEGVATNSGPNGFRDSANFMNSGRITSFSNTQTNFSTAAVSSYAETGDAGYSFHCGGFTAVYLRHPRGGNGLDVLNGGNGYAPVRASSFAVSSDARLKENVKPIENALGVISKMNPVTFDWIESGKSDDGFIAQEFLNIPELKNKVSSNTNPDGEDMYSVDYPRLVSYLTKAIQEQQIQIELLNTKIDKLNIK